MFELKMKALLGTSLQIEEEKASDGGAAGAGEEDKGRPKAAVLSGVDGPGFSGAEMGR